MVDLLQGSGPCQGIPPLTPSCARYREGAAYSKGGAANSRALPESIPVPPGLLLHFTLLLCKSLIDQHSKCGNRCNRRHNMRRIHQLLLPNKPALCTCLHRSLHNNQSGTTTSPRSLFITNHKGVNRSLVNMKCSHSQSAESRASPKKNSHTPPPSSPKCLQGPNTQSGSAKPRAE